jgi:hypothetical protein
MSMSVVVNDLTIEPATERPKPQAAPAEKPAKSGPELAREIEKLHRKHHDRALRVWAH